MTGVQTCALPISLLAGVFALVGVIVDVSLIFPRLQNAETGEFDVTGLAVTDGLADSFWLPVILVSVVCALVCAGLLIARGRLLKNAQSEN